MLGWRAILFVALSLALIFCDYKLQFFQPLRRVLIVAVYPIQLLADVPNSFIKWTSESFSTHKSLLRENAQLKVDQLLLQTKTQKLGFLEAENAQLRAMLSLTKQLESKVMAAQLFAIDADDFDHEVILDKGNKDGVYTGQPVLDSYGIVGQVVEVNDFSSRVMLVTDSKSAVPVFDVRNGMRAIAVGIGDSNLMELAHVPDTADVKIGDVLVTSGIGVLSKRGAQGDNKLGYPAGYSVGVIGQVVHMVGERFVKVIVVPAARINSSRYVLLLWPDKYVQELPSAKTKEKATVNSKKGKIKIRGKK